MKRETGENPVRTRHRVLQAEATDPLGEPGREQMCQSNKPGDLPLRSTGTKVQATRNWQYEMDHRTVCGIIQFYFRCLRFLTEAFFGYIFGRS